MTYESRRNFGQAVRRARRAGTLKEFARHSYGYARIASLTDGTYLLYKGPGALVDPCERDEAYERAAARYDGSGRDWR